MLMWDRLLLTFTPSKRGINIAYGLDGFDDPAMQTTAGLLALPFRNMTPSARVGVTGRRQLA